MKQAVAVNPILSGFYPDPSICRVDKDFYLVPSSFACFPGVPIFKSNDLAHWEQIGNILDRNSQIPLMNCGHSAGIYAPTLRYHDGLFYMITTNVSAADSTGNKTIADGNFIVTAKNPEGPWSEPYYLGEAAPGIDPSLFFDEDGTCYYCGTRPNSNGVKYNGDWEIWVQNLDLTTMELTGESTAVWNGAMRDVIWPEGPHIYKINGWYYILHAEGGTGPDHCVAIARSKCITGPYTGYPSNPILTHRHLGKAYPIRYVGHADLVNVPASMTLSGEEKWYMVCLASRPCDGFTLLGRETFLTEVIWEDGWPVVNPGVGKLTETLTIDLPEAEFAEKKKQYHFDGGKFPAEMVALRNPEGSLYSLEERPGYLHLPLKEESLKDCANAAFIGIRQTDFDFEAEAFFEFKPKTENEAAGLVLLQSNQFHLKLQIVKKGNRAAAQAVLVHAPEVTGAINGDGEAVEIIEKLLVEQTLGTIDSLNYYEWELICRGLFLQVRVTAKENEAGSGRQVILAENISISELSTETAGGFVGNLIGLFASSNGKKTDSYMDVKSFSYQKND